jgi:hypothetical protein
MPRKVALTCCSHSLTDTPAAAASFCALEAAVSCFLAPPLSPSISGAITHESDRRFLYSVQATSSLR